ncbi:hypothetical protein [Ramlibacter pallidus]|uniref:Uncharacterized protein n=1 Tax=Ramlibacter pallidus TaxID=2780087 RepID=A0ABR9S298_9BURK|nr:hypothetical protein [Ramlibacter pallidus]MBE7367172.1 hypothetical protein [Ramlibacter pallidus]
MKLIMRWRKGASSGSLAKPGQATARMHNGIQPDVTRVTQCMRGGIAARRRM